MEKPIKIVYAVERALTQRSSYLSMSAGFVIYILLIIIQKSWMKWKKISEFALSKLWTNEIHNHYDVYEAALLCEIYQLKA